uniref:G protein-coupled receptor n=1 Tax=Panagrellus redivivus TaxID=6233 RepID=A0A7E4VWY3_PANRE
MGPYKYYILNFQVAATLFDLHISFVFSPLAIFPAPAMCSTSVLFLKQYWIFEYVNFILMHFTLSYVGVSILIGLLYRYCALKGNLNFFHSKRGVAIIALGNLIYPIPVTVALLFTHSNRENSLDYIRNEYPGYYELFAHNGCHGVSEPGGMIIYAVVAAGQIIAVATCSGITMFKINHLMKEKKLNFTKKTYDLHRQLIYSLWVQAFLPTCFLAIPTVMAFVMIINTFGNLRGKKRSLAIVKTSILAISLTIMPVLCLHSAVLGVSTIIMTKPYRQATISILLRPLRLCFKEAVIPKASVQITVSHRLSTNISGQH